MNNEMQEIYIEIDTAKEHVRKAELVQRLENSSDFKELVLDGYFRDNAARLVMLKTDPLFESDDMQAKLEKDMLGISVFGDYLRTIKIQGEMAKQSLEEHEPMLEELRKEG